MLFFNNIRFQIAAAAVLIIIIFDYLRNPHLKLMSTNAFRAMLICTVCNLMLDISTVYTVTHLDTVPPQLNRFLHQLFIASVIMVLFFNFLYVLILNRNQERLTKILAEYDIPPAFINLEITETAALDSGEAFDTNVSALRESGFSFSMDDFGTGYSNLSQMNQMRYDLVKMDKSIIWDAFGKGNEKSEHLLASVIRLLKAINVKIVAEGVETKEMTDYLTERGVDYLQGYYFSKPVNEDKFLEVISA